MTAAYYCPNVNYKLIDFLVSQTINSCDFTCSCKVIDSVEPFFEAWNKSRTNVFRHRVIEESSFSFNKLFSWHEVTILSNSPMVKCILSISDYYGRVMYLTVDCMDNLSQFRLQGWGLVKRKQIHVRCIYLSSQL